MWVKETAEVETDLNVSCTKPITNVRPEEAVVLSSREQRGSLIGALNYARPRPFHIPRPISQSYPAFKAKQELVLRIGIKDLETQITKSTGIACLEVIRDKLTLRPHSQSKLSQQELQDLQKATHFDKKELQQWYKGMRAPDTLH